jgi:hypothetical protein
MLLASGATSPALAACVSKQCPDATLVQQAQVIIEEMCGCTRAGQTHRGYMKCVKTALRDERLTALMQQRPCRNVIMRCAKSSICGKRDAVVCCQTKKSGKVVASIRKSAKCKNGRACGASLGLYSTFDACDTTGVCAGGTVTTTTLTSTVTTTTLSSCEAARAAFEATLPVPTPAAPGRYVVQLVNESDVTLLAAANAAHRFMEPPFHVLPREGTWVIPPQGVLTIDIPEQWERTIGDKVLGGAVGPLFWARTGCRYDIAHDFAQCETGNCSGIYDCSKANQSAPGPKSLAEWTFNDLNGNSAPDVSVVDGVNLNMDIAPLGPHTQNNPAFVRWLNHPLVNCGGDQRDAPWCPERFRLTRKQLPMFIQGSPGGDDVVACFSNCGFYKYPDEPNLHCNPDPVTDLRCYYWKSFCCAFALDGFHPYDGPCTSDADCTQNGSCWNNGLRQTCSCRAFNKLPDCPPNQCTFPYSQNIANQPPFGLCSDVTNRTGDADACVGDDTFHYVMPYGLTWPNDPETFFSDAHAYRIVFAPGGTGIPITPAGPIPACSSLPAAYDYPKAVNDCALVANKIFAGAQLPPLLWQCSIADGTASAGILCRW